VDSPAPTGVIAGVAKREIRSHSSTHGTVTVATASEGSQDSIQSSATP
jgi:hypothetical protein